MDSVAIISHTDNYNGQMVNITGAPKIMVLD